jgi:hypothetical protein
VLKRIAECKFVDPRVANPRIGNRLGRIILRAMAAQPNDRYPAIGEMVVALENYLEESGLETDKVTSELARYFKAPAPYELALKERLVDHLTRRGQKLLTEGEQTPALDVFDRVLTIDPQNEKVLGILDGLNRRARLKTVAIGLLAIGAIGAGGYMIHKRSQPPVPQPPPDPIAATGPFLVGPNTHVNTVEPPPADIDAGVAIVVSDAPGGAARPPNGSNGSSVIVTPPLIDAGPAVEPPVDVTVTTTVAGAEWRFPNGTWQPVSGKTFSVPVSGPTTIEVQHDCCQTVSVELDRTKKDAIASLQFRPAQLRPMCDGANVSVSVKWTADGKEEKRYPTVGSRLPIPFDKNATSRSRAVTVEFTNGEKTDPQTVTVEAGKTTEVKCAL